MYSTSQTGTPCTVSYMEDLITLTMKNITACGQIYKPVNTRCLVGLGISSVMSRDVLDSLLSWADTLYNKKVFVSSSFGKNHKSIIIPDTKEV